MNLYTARVKHSPDTVRRFTVIQYDTFEPFGKVIRFALAVALIIAGAFSGSSAALVFLLFLGCVLLTNLNSKALSVADQVEKAMHGSFPELHYSFSEDRFTDGPERPEVLYSALIRLIEDNDYLYLFASKSSGYMIETASVTGDGGAEGLKRLISEKSGCEWKRPLTLATLKLKDLFSSIGNKVN